jgi:hypothetical protein
MGFGDFGSNGSMHWQVNYRDAAGPPDTQGRDDRKKHPRKPGADPRPPIGDGKAGAGLLRVTIRCNTSADAAKMLTDALNAVKAASAKDFTLDVPIKDYRNTPPNTGNRDEWEIGVDW